MSLARPTTYGQRQGKVPLPGWLAKAGEANFEAGYDSPPGATPGPLRAGRGEGTEGDWATTFNVLKAIMGAGGFALPWAFARTGLLGGVAAVSACALLGVFTVRELVALKALVEAERARPGASYVDVAREAFGGPGAGVVYALTLVCSLGVTSAYLVFIGTILHSLAPTMSQQALVLLTAAVVLPITWLQDFSLLSRLSEYGTYAVVLGYAVTLSYAAGLSGRSRAPHETPALASAMAAPSWSSAAKGFGPVAFLFCVHFLLFPVMTASRASARPGGFERIALAAFAVAGAVNAGFGAAGLLAFHGQVSSIVINDIAEGTWYVVATKLLLCVDLFCSYPLVLASGRQIVERSLMLEESTGEGLAATTQQQLGLAVLSLAGGLGAQRRAVRTGLVLITVLVAQVRDFGTIISLVGGFAQVSLAFVLPPLMALRLMASKMAMPRLLANLLVLPLGCAVAALATATTLAEVMGH